VVGQFIGRHRLPRGVGLLAEPRLVERARGHLWLPQARRRVPAQRLAQRAHRENCGVRGASGSGERACRGGAPRLRATGPSPSSRASSCACTPRRTARRSSWLLNGRSYGRRRAMDLRELRADLVRALRAREDRAVGRNGEAIVARHELRTGSLRRDRSAAGPAARSRPTAGRPVAHVRSASRRRGRAGAETTTGRCESSERRRVRSSATTTATELPRGRTGARTRTTQAALPVIVPVRAPAGRVAAHRVGAGAGSGRACSMSRCGRVPDDYDTAHSAEALPGRFFGTD